MDDDLKTAVSGGFVAFVLLGCLVVLLGLFGLFWNRTTAPYAEETRAQVYDKSRAYNQGMNRDIARYCREYRAADGAAKSAVADLIRTTADTYQGAYTPANQACLSEIGQ